MQEQEKELFAGYEIKNWNLSPRIYKIIVASAILNLFGVFVMAQGNLLTRKGCDSPLVSSICQVLDTVVLGSSLLATDTEYVSKDYEKNELGDADITYIDVSNDSPPLKYPEGYFALANPEQFVMPQTALNSSFDMSGFPTIPSMPPAGIGSSSSDLLASKPNLPPVNDNPIVGPLPSSISGSNPFPKYRMPKFNRGIPKYVKPKQSPIPNDSPNELPKLDGETAKNKTDKPKSEKTPDANQKPIESEKVADVEINKKPFEDLGDDLNDKLEKKQVDLSKPFSVVLDATITADGKFDTTKSRFGKTEGDQQMVDVAKKALESVGNSGILSYLKIYGIDRVNFTLVQDDKQIYAIIKSEQKTPEKAQTSVSLINAALQGLIFADNNGIKKLDDNSKTLVNNSKVTSNGKSFILNFMIPKPMGQDLINRSLKERAAKKNSSQPGNSSGVNQNSNAQNGK
ncbi:MAG: hypothetical protein M3033_00455 [Acidobacteriota bacterium]|nr:hypothetical protein [Acidobacteriota bacterium]